MMLSFYKTLDPILYGDPLSLQKAHARPHVIKAKLRIEKIFPSVQSWLKGDALINSTSICFNGELQELRGIHTTSGTRGVWGPKRWKFKGWVFCWDRVVEPNVSKVWSRDGWGWHQNLPRCGHLRIFSLNPCEICELGQFLDTFFGKRMCKQRWASIWIDHRHRIFTYCV